MRRARFVGAALAGIACGPSRGPETPVVVPVAVADASAPIQSGPNADRDGDDVPDADDKCPDDPEDRDGFEDADGCPDPDNDKDGIADAVDACPNEPGVPNPDPAGNGCPGRVPIARVCLSIIIIQRVEFTSGTTIAPSSTQLLDATAQSLANQPQLTLECEGHTDDKEAASIGKARAEAVKRELVKRGIDAARITTTSAGSTQPLAPNTTAENRARNRRVELHPR
jgi:outer membrane protein OmpA-like peptidoglycan-associated protein